MRCARSLGGLNGVGTSDAVSGMPQHMVVLDRFGPPHGGDVLTAAVYQANAADTAADRMLGATTAACH